jgi:hypothetical protein
MVKSVLYVMVTEFLLPVNSYLLIEWLTICIRMHA